MKISELFFKSIINLQTQQFDTGLSKTSGYQDQERIYCNFTHSVSTPPEADPKLVQPLDQPYYIIMAYGAASAEGSFDLFLLIFLFQYDYKN